MLRKTWKQYLKFNVESNPICWMYHVLCWVIIATLNLIRIILNSNNLAMSKITLDWEGHNNDKVQLKHFQGHPFLKETGHFKMLLCYENELWISYVMKWKSAIWPWKIFSRSPFSTGNWPMVRCCLWWIWA